MEVGALLIAFGFAIVASLLAEFVRWVWRIWAGGVERPTRIWIIRLAVAIGGFVGGLLISTVVIPRPMVQITDPLNGAPVAVHMLANNPSGSFSVAGISKKIPGTYGVLCS